MDKIGVIINPYAKKVKKRKSKILDIYNAIAPDIIDVHMTKSLDEVDLVLSKFKKDKVKYIGIAGGDGTLHNVLSKMVTVYGPQKLPPIVILKGGTMDNVSRTIKLKGHGPAILQRLVKKVKNGKEIQIHRRDTMEINGNYFFLFGIGLVTNFLNEVYSRKKNFVTNIKVTMKALKQAMIKPKGKSIFDGIDGLVTIDTEKIPFNKVTGILAGTVEHVNTLFAPIYRANEKDGTFHVLTLGLTPLQFVSRLLPLLNGRNLKCKNYSNLIGKTMLIKSNEPFEYTMDGDMYTCKGSLKITLGPAIYLVKA